MRAWRDVILDNEQMHDGPKDAIAFLRKKVDMSHADSATAQKPASRHRKSKPKKTDAKDTKKQRFLSTGIRPHRLRHPIRNTLWNK